MSSNINYANTLTKQIMEITREIASVSPGLDLNLLLKRMKERKELINELFSLNVAQDLFRDIIKQVRDSDAITMARLRFAYEDVRMRLHRLNDEKKVTAVYSYNG